MSVFDLRLFFGQFATANWHGIKDEELKQLESTHMVIVDAFPDKFSNESRAALKSVVAFQNVRGYSVSACGSQIPSAAQDDFLDIKTWNEFLSNPKSDDSVNEPPYGPGIYVLEIRPAASEPTDSYQFYVGKSDNVKSRVDEHKSGGADGKPRVTAIYKDRLEYRPPITKGDKSDLESWERREVLELMHIHGIEKVRGWMFTLLTLVDEDKVAAKRQLCERFDLCRKCGQPGHMIGSDVCNPHALAEWMKDLDSEFLNLGGSADAMQVETPHL